MRAIHELLALTAALTAILANPGIAAQPTPASKATAQDSATTNKNALRAQAFKAKQDREFSKAGDLFLKLQKLDPTDPELYLLAGECLEKSKRYNDALDVLESGRKRFPAELRFSVGIARNYNLKAHDLLNSSGKFDNFVLFTLEDCVREAEAVLQKHAGNRDMRLILAQTLYTLRKLDKCKTNAEELVKRFPDHPGGYILLGDLAYQRYVGLVQASRQKGADTSKEAMQKVTIARDLARKRYEKALSLDKNRVIAHRKLGELHAWNGDRMGALAKYAEALAIDPTTGVSHDWIKRNFGAAKRFDFYKKAAQAHLELPKPDKKKAALLVWYAASARYEEKHWKEAENLFLECVAANEDYVDSYSWAMSAAIECKALDRAARHSTAFATVAPIRFADIIRTLPGGRQLPVRVRTSKVRGKTLLRGITIDVAPSRYAKAVPGRLVIEGLPNFAKLSFLVKLAAPLGPKHPFKTDAVVEWLVGQGHTRAHRLAGDVGSITATFQVDGFRELTIAHIQQFAIRAYQARRFAAARDISHVLAAVLDTAANWNDYAFLCRETRMYKESFAAYENALQVEPEDPQLLNDAAVILDFHLGTTEQIRQAERVHRRLMKTRRMIAYESPPLDEDSLKNQVKANLRRAADMYAEAAKLADKALRSGKVDKKDVERYRTARRDARNNLRKLKPRLK